MQIRSRGADGARVPRKLRLKVLPSCEGSGAPGRRNVSYAAPHRRTLPSASASGAAARHRRFAVCSPSASGALALRARLRLSLRRPNATAHPGRASRDAAHRESPVSSPVPVQRVFLRPVVMPVRRIPGAARERGYEPRAQAPLSLLVRDVLENAPHERDAQSCNRNGDHVNENVTPISTPHRHGRACPGHPRLAVGGTKDMDARDERGHDDIRSSSLSVKAPPTPARIAARWSPILPTASRGEGKQRP